MFSSRYGHRFMLCTVLWMAAVGATTAQQIEGPHAKNRRFFPDDPLWSDADKQDTPPVALFELDQDYDFLQASFLNPGGGFGPAFNVNTLGEVPDSTWFTNRIGRYPMTLEEVARGPNTVSGPAPGAWVIVGRPDAGITPKFTIRDARGDRYLIKLDPVNLPEMASSAEIISTKILYAAGYHVPENYLVGLDPSRLEIDPSATWKDAKGKRRPIVQSDVDHWLKDHIGRSSDGRIRVMASRYIPGSVVGQFRFHGTRSDDPNDIYPHEHHRQLRALRVFAAWLNHDDSRAINTLDAYVEDNGARYLMHYLIDFGSTLGSGSTEPQEPRAGYEYYVETPQALKGIFGFGIWRRDWMNVKYPDHAAVGRYEADFFEPWKWKPEYPNPAFDRMDTVDAFWGARLASRFSDAMIRAIVAEAKISSPDAENYLTETLIRRRQKVVNYWIARTNPLDSFRIVAADSEGLELTFENAAVRVGAAKGEMRYTVQWAALDNLTGAEQQVSEELSLAAPRLSVPPQVWGPPDDAGLRYAIASIAGWHPGFPHWAQPIRVALRNRNGAVDVVGVDRPHTLPAIPK